MIRQQFQLSSGLYGSADKQNLTDKIFQRGRVIGLYRKGNLSYRKMSKDVLNRITTKAMKHKHKFQEKMIYSNIKGKAYTLKLGNKDALPEIERNQNFLCHIYGRKKIPFESSLPKHSRKQSEASSYISHNKSARLNQIDEHFLKETPNIKTRFKRNLSQLIHSCTSVLRQIQN